MSTVRRPGAHRAYLRDVSKQTTILRLQGFMFFGTITHVEDAIRALLDEGAWQRTPIRFLVLDLALVAGVDMSAAEAFVRVQRLLATKKVVLVLCGFAVDSGVGHALGNVGLLDMDGVELFETFSDAIECEWLTCMGRQSVLFVHRDGEHLSASMVHGAEDRSASCW